MTSSDGSRRRSIIVMAFGLVIATAVGFGIFWLLNLGTPGAERDFGTRFSPVVDVANGLMFSVVGALIASRRPDNAVGWICLGTGILMNVSAAAGEYAVYALLTMPDSIPGGQGAAWVTNWTWPLYIGLLGTVLILVFPDGRLPSRRWRPVMVVAMAAMASAAISLAISPGLMTAVPWAGVNPFGIEDVDFALEILSLGFVFTLATFVAALVSMVLRFRRARGELRQQIKWFASAAALVTIAYVGQGAYAIATGTIGDSGEAQRIVQTMVVATFGVLAGAVGVAVLRHRLYQIDQVISRTVSYGLVTATLLLVYLLSVFVLGSVLPYEGDLAVAVSTLTVAALFAPVRRRVQNAVDRRFNRSRYDAGRTVEDFQNRLRQTTDLRGISWDLSAVTGKIMQPSHLSLWLRDDP